MGIGSQIEIPEELIKTVEENPEVPKEGKPLEWLVDKVEEIDSKKAEEAKQAKLTNSNANTKTPVQEIVEKHYAKNTSPSDDVSVKEDQKTSEEGIITGSL